MEDEVSNLLPDGRPTLTPYIREVILAEQFRIQESYWQELEPMCAPEFMAAVVYQPGSLFKGGPRMPAQPLILFGVLGSFARDLFDAEVRHYDQSFLYDRTLYALATHIETFCTAKVNEMTTPLKSLGHHATQDAMRTAVRTALTTHVMEILGRQQHPRPRKMPTGTIAASTPRANEISKTGLSLQERLQALVDETNVTADDIATAVKLDVRSVYRHLAGGIIRKKNRKAYEAFLDSLR